MGRAASEDVGALPSAPRTPLVARSDLPPTTVLGAERARVAGSLESPARPTARPDSGRPRHAAARSGRGGSPFVL